MSPARINDRYRPRQSVVHAPAPAVLRVALTVALCLAQLAGLPDATAQAWPTRPLRLLVPSTAGGATDAYGRTVAEMMGKSLGQPVVVENRPTAGGIQASEAVAHAPADGYTMLMGTMATLTINPASYPRLPYAVSDFVPLCKGVGFPLVLVVHPSVDVKGAADLARWLKANPASASYASYQPGTPSHFLGYQLGEKLGIPLTHVPYKGSSPQVVDLVGGVVPLGFTQLQTALPHLRSGRLRALATTGEQRAAALPDVPTLAQVGWGDLTTSSWFGLLAPRGTPPDIVERLIDAHRKALADPAVVDKLAAQGLDVSSVCGSDFARLIQQDTARWARVVKATGFTASD